MSKKKIQEGVMVVKEDKGWGKIYGDGHSTTWGWVPLTEAPLHDPEFCTKPTDVTYPDSPYIPELKTARLVRVKKTTSVEILE